MNYFVSLSVRSLLARWKQYRSLFLVCAVGVAVSLFSLFVINGMLDALTTKAKIYYAGDFQFLSVADDKAVPNSAELVSDLSSVLPGDAVVSSRIKYHATDRAEYYFEGNSVKQRFIYGVDFEKERELFNKFNYVSGGIAEIAGTNGVILSEPIANMLQASVGDIITFVLETYEGYSNSIDLVLKGVFRDSSIFGMYTSYIDIDCMRTALSVDGNWSNLTGIYFPSRHDANKGVEKFLSLCRKKFPMYDTFNEVDDFNDLVGEVNELKYALIPLNANLTDLKIVIDAMRIVSSLVIIALIIIIVVGISSTYRVIVMKRINEIGIYKAIGMDRGHIFKLLIVETVVLLVAGCLVGLTLSGIFSAIIKTFDFSFIPAFDVFLTNRLIVPVANINEILTVFAVVIVTTVLAVLFAIEETVKITPVEALAVTE